VPGTGDIPGLGDLLDQLGIPTLDPDALAALQACGGFNGSNQIAQSLQATFGPVSPNGPQEPFPIDSARTLLDYPEDIQMYGLSTTTNLGKWSLAAEYSFRPNLPLQIQVSDLLFAAVQPAFPDEDIPLVLGTIPGERNAVPDIVETQFRGNTVQGGQRIDGFERFPVHQLDLTGIRIFGPGNPLFADQIVLLVELGMTRVVDMTDPQTLPLESLWFNGTHPSAGADGTGSGGQTDARRLNPTQQTKNFPDDFSMGYRILARMQYSNLLFGLSFNPVFVFQHDVEGIAPFPIQNFVEDRKQIIAGTEVTLTQSVSGQIVYESYFDGEFNNLEDRDNLALSVSYSF